MSFTRPWAFLTPVNPQARQLLLDNKSPAFAWPHNPRPPHAHHMLSWEKGLGPGRLRGAGPASWPRTSGEESGAHTWPLLILLWAQAHLLSLREQLLEPESGHLLQLPLRAREEQECCVAGLRLARSGEKACVSEHGADEYCLARRAGEGRFQNLWYTDSSRPVAPFPPRAFAHGEPLLRHARRGCLNRRFSAAALQITTSRSRHLQLLEARD